MRNNRRNPYIPKGKNRDFRELDTIDTDPTERFTKQKQSSRNASGSVDDIGPAVGGLNKNTPLTFADLESVKKIFGWVFGGVAAISGIIWWAATIQSDVTSLLSDVETIEKSTQMLEKNSVRQDMSLQQLQKDVSSLQTAPSSTVTVLKNKK